PPETTLFPYTTLFRSGIIIELVFREDTSGEWPVNLVQALNEIIQTDPHSGINSIHLRFSSVPEPASKSMVVRWEFLNLNREPLRSEEHTSELQSLRHI